MIYYEMLMLLRPDIVQDTYDDIKNKIEAIIKKDFNGEVKTYDKWGKYLLAYPIQKCAYGIYVLIRFGIEKSNSEVIEKIKSFCILKYNTIIMRYVFINKGDVFNENYCKPDSLEDAPRREKENEEVGMVWTNKNKYINRKNNYYKNNNNDSSNLDIESELKDI